MSYLLNDRCEQAFVALLAPIVGALAAVVPSKDAATKELPIVICSADGEGEEDPKGTGNFWLEHTIQIKSIAEANDSGTAPGDNPVTTNQTLVSLVMTAILVDNLPALLSAAVADFTVFPNGVLRDAPRRSQDEAGAWIDELKLKLYCCASTIAA